MKEDNYKLKIIGGKFKGKNLIIPSDSTTRSSKSIIRGSVFDTLQFDIIDSNFVEVFAGSGSIGIEAISRGAKDTYFIERDNQAFKILKENLKITDNSNATVLFGDSFEKINEIILKLEEKNEKAYFYIDPPFPIREDMDGIYDRIIEMIKLIPSNVIEMVIIEHMTLVKFPDDIAKLKQTKSKKFGKTSLTYYQF